MPAAKFVRKPLKVIHIYIKDFGDALLDTLIQRAGGDPRIRLPGWGRCEIDDSYLWPPGRSSAFPAQASRLSRHPERGRNGRHVDRSAAVRGHTDSRGEMAEGLAPDQRTVSRAIPQNFLETTGGACGGV